MSCDKCGKEFADGEEAYEQVFKMVHVNGNTATTRIVTLVVCSECAEE